MNMKNETFGKRVRRMRMAKQITLRKFAEMIGVSPTYVSQIERDELDPPPENRVKAIAEILGENIDEWLALAKRVPSDLPAIIQRHPKEVAIFLRTAEGYSKEDWENLIKQISKNPTEKKGKGQ